MINALQYSRIDYLVWPIVAMLRAISSNLPTMAQIFVSAGHGGLENGVLDPGYVLPNTTEAAEMKLLRDMVLAELRSQLSQNAVKVPDELSAAQTLAWINGP